MSKPKILLVEDNTSVSTLIKLRLEKAKYDVTICKDGDEALEAIHEDVPDLIISDIMMPGMDGMEFRNKLNKLSGFNLIPFIFLTAKDQLNDKIKGFESGANYYLTKPVIYDELIAILNVSLSKYRAYENLINVDNLTGILNRRAIEEKLNIEINRLNRYNNIFSIAIIDVDNFKEINDTHGHLTGDHILKCVAGKILNTLRDCDYAGRYGGDEFMVIMPETMKESAHHTIERIRESLNTMKFGNKNIDLTISSGISSAPDEGSDVKKLISSADKFLYEAKNRGRNLTLHSDI